MIDLPIPKLFTCKFTENEVRLLVDALYTNEKYTPLHPDLIPVREHLESQII